MVCWLCLRSVCVYSICTVQSVREGQRIKCDIPSRFNQYGSKNQMKAESLHLPHSDCFISTLCLLEYRAEKMCHIPNSYRLHCIVGSAWLNKAFECFSSF